MRRISLLISVIMLLALVLTACDDAVEVVDTPDVEVVETVDEDVSDGVNDDVDETEEVVEEEMYPEQVVPESVKDLAVAYSIFPIAFADSDGNGMGDIQGVIDGLDYLKDELNVDVIWLNPVHPSPSYHKYDVTDYYDIDPNFGTLDDYKRLIEEAHNRDIKVLLDYVINHSSSQHPWFINSRQGTDSEYRDWYTWNTLTEDKFNSTSGWYSVSGQDEKYFASFWSEMPELNFSNEEVREEIKEISTYWLEMGVDGFRIDAAKHVFDINEYPTGTPVLEENYQWFKEFNAHIKSVNPESFLLLETWEGYNSVANYLTGAEAAFNFDLGASIISAINSENRKEIQGKVTKIYSKYDKISENYIDAVFLTNHDQDRLVSQLGEDEDKAKLAATINFTLPGLSWIYYGEELGMTGTGDHENIREGFKWSMDQSQIPNSSWRAWNYAGDIEGLDVQMADESSMFNHYKEVTSLKSDNPVLKSGTYIDYEIGTSFRIFAFFRQYEGETYLVMHNLHDEMHSFDLSESVEEIIYESNGSFVAGSTIRLEPLGSVVVKVSSEAVTAEELE